MVFTLKKSKHIKDHEMLLFHGVRAVSAHQKYWWGTTQHHCDTGKHCFRYKWKK